MGYGANSGSGWVGDTPQTVLSTKVPVVLKEGDIMIGTTTPSSQSYQLSIKASER